MLELDRGSLQNSFGTALRTVYRELTNIDTCSRAEVWTQRHDHRDSLSRGSHQIYTSSKFM